MNLCATLNFKMKCVIVTLHTRYINLLSVKIKFKCKYFLSVELAEEIDVLLKISQIFLKLLFLRDSPSLGGPCEPGSVTTFLWWPLDLYHKGMWFTKKLWTTLGVGNLLWVFLKIGKFIGKQKRKKKRHPTHLRRNLI